MKKIIGYLILWLVGAFFLFFSNEIVAMPLWYTNNLIFGKCLSIGIIGGVLYCLKGIYFNKCVRKNWDANWEIWYYLRPINSAISGFISCIFVKAGLFALEAASDTNAVSFGFLAIAFIAGYNVDNFLKKIESIAHSKLGIENTRMAKEAEAE